ncbi:MAG: TAXI family TRAP transporter solute-binding subunit [Motilibacteraceae bacterium]
MRARPVALLLLALLTPAAALAGCSRGGPTYAAGSVTLATGGTRGVYYAFGSEVGSVAGRRLPGAPVTVLPTSGSVENLRRAAAAPRVFAFSALDAATDAVQGTGPFTRPLRVAAVARVYDDYFHVVVPASSGLRALPDLVGHRVSLGAPGSGTALIAQRVLSTAGIEPGRVTDLGLGIDESIDALAEGRIDAFFWSGGVPTAGIADLAARLPVRLLPLGDLAGQMRERYGTSYRAATLPADAYGLDSPVDTLAVPNLIVTSVDTDPALVEAVTRLLFEGRAEISRTVPLAGALDRRSAIFTSPVPLHPGAVAWYRAAQS